LFTETDEFFAHQIVAPHAEVALNDPSFADRAYHALSDPDRFGLDIGISMYPNREMFHAYAVAAVPGRQWSLRATRDFSEGRWELRAGPISATILEPLKRWRFTCAPNDGGISFDLEFEARHAAYEIEPPAIRKKSRLIHHDQYMFQNGYYSGTVTLDDNNFDVDRMPGVRDRTWGVRAAGEGQLPHGVFAWLQANFDDFSVQALIRDRGDEVPQLRAGAIFYDSGETVPLVDFKHELKFDYDTRQFTSGTLSLTDASGKVWNAEITPTIPIYLSGGGYTGTSTRRDRFTQPLWYERWDLTDADLVQRVEGLADNICRVSLNGLEGHGLLETSIGEHVRYAVREPVEWA